MPLFLLVVGVFLVIVAINDKMKELGGLAKEDLSLGRNGFIPWIIAVYVIGALGYVKTARPVANGFLVLIVVSIFIANRGFFDKFTQALGVSK